MSAEAKALRTALVAHAESPEVTRFSRGDKRIAMEHDSLQWRVSPKALATNEHLAPKDDANVLRHFLSPGTTRLSLKRMPCARTTDST